VGIWRIVRDKELPQIAISFFLSTFLSVDAMPVNMPPPMAFPSSSSTDGDPRICGRMEMALLYLAQKRELIISLSRAYDLVPRPDANPLRNPYVKLFLLPDRRSSTNKMQ